MMSRIRVLMIALMMVGLMVGSLSLGAEETINVLIATAREGAMLQVTGAHNIYNPYGGGKLATRFSGKSAFMQPYGEGLKWGEMFAGVYQLEFVSDHPEISIIVDGTEYKGKIRIYQVEGKINIINEVGIEDYVMSVMAAQVSDALAAESLDQESLAALTIVTRTDACYQVQNSKNEFWDVAAKETGYKGCAVAEGREDIGRAVLATRHMVMQTGGKPFAARWTGHSAGKTAPYHVIFRGQGNAPGGVEAPFAGFDRKTTAWSVAIDKTTLARIGGLDKVTDVKVLADKDSGKVYGVQLQDERFTKVIDFSTLQDNLGRSQLKSSDFTVSVEGERFVFSGVGEGHGVGLCLYSAKKMAQRGDDAGKILKGFFPDTQISLVKGLRSSQGARA